VSVVTGLVLKVSSGEDEGVAVVLILEREEGGTNVYRLPERP